jgi:hypothetical protein
MQVISRKDFWVIQLGGEMLVKCPCCDGRFETAAAARAVYVALHDGRLTWDGLREGGCIRDIIFVAGESETGQ